MIKKGKIILIEGADFSGKATQTEFLINKLKSQNIPCEAMSFPRYNTPTGRIVGQCYLGKEREYWKGNSNWFGEADSLDPKIASLYYAGDRRAAVPEINKIIESGTNLVLDRYYTSNMAHQGGKIRDISKRLDLFKFINKLELELLELPKEDVTLFLHMPTEVAIELKKRMKKEGDEHEKNIGHIKRAEDTYLQLSRLYDWTKIECAPDGTIKSLRTPENIHEEVYQHVIDVINL